MKNARQIAFDILIKIKKDNSYSNLTVDSILSSSELNSRDYSFVCAIVYGVLERSITLDYTISKYLSSPLKKLKPEVLIILRMGVYQLLFMDKVPDSAAINESVKLAKSNKSAYASALVNAVLHKVQKNGLALPDKDNNKTEYLSIKYSYPQWLIGKWIKYYGEENAVGIMEKSIGRPPMTARVNTLKTTKSDLIKELEKEGVLCENTPIENAINLYNTGDIEKLSAFKDGLFHIQDMASQYCAMALGAKRGEVVLDLCAAPGGKSFTIAQMMENEGSLLSFDIFEHRVGLIEQGAERLGINIIKASVSDAERFNSDIGMADRVLCDVPCSGLGIIRRKPEIRLKSPEDIDKLPNIQYVILVNASKYVKKGGRLIYSTCTLNKQENEKVCKRFLEENKNFKAVKVLPEVKRFNNDDKFITLLPHINNTDGFFICALERTE
ncbi:MAG: 16S rRNA (cytosine(967)-C(5))-methyltransferase RsmB [Clostridiales bacterium]|nr:16S rRNA (cytosine(967)-C(5))-methyltransferase RsmB [Clostridiales bacterium]